MAITDEILALRKEQELAQQEKQGPAWIKELIDRRYAPQQARIKRVPVGFDFKRDPFDPSSYYNRVGSFRDISRGATAVVNQEVANKKNTEAQRAWEEAMNSLNNIQPKFVGGDNSLPPGHYPGDGHNHGPTFQWNGKTRNYGLKRVTPNVSNAANYWGSKYGIKTIGGYRERGSVPGSDHPKGRALDYMTNNIKNGMKVGTALANDIIKNYKAWNVSYVIWNNYIWSPSRGWRRYNGPSPHTDHVHVSFNK